MKNIELIVTAKDTPYRMAVLSEHNFLQKGKKESKTIDSQIKINREKTYQKVIGFGGAFTVSASEALKGVSEEIRKEAMEAYFDPVKGIGYNFCRTHMGSCDFSINNYSYNAVDGDVRMECFSVECDENTLIPLIKNAQKYNKNLLIYSAPWSPPSWMKSNKNMAHGGKLKEEYKEAFALYFVKYLEEYRKKGIPIWGITPQNEPVEIQEWASCYYTGPEEADFIRNYLYPALCKHKLTDVKIMIWDSNKDQIYERVSQIASDLFLKKYVFGAAFHWYSGDYFEQLDAVHKDFPELMLISTESCVAFQEDLEDWSIGERYGHEIIGDMNHWTSGYIDWNLFLNEKGGPNLVGNYCVSPIILDNNKNELIYMSSYYYIGHFSKYIHRDSVRTECNTSFEGIEACAFIRPDQSSVVVAMNRTDREIDTEISIVNWSKEESYTLHMFPHSIVTVIVKEDENIV